MRCFKTALPPKCPLPIAKAVVQKMKTHLKERLERSLSAMEKRILLLRTFSPTTSEHSNPDKTELDMDYFEDGMDKTLH